MVSAPRAKRVAPAMLILCLVLAVATVLLMPMLVGGAFASPGAPAAASEPVLGREAVDYASYEDAVADLDFAPRLPQAIPAGYGFAAVRVLDGRILELEYASGRSSLVYRTALGNEDISDVFTEYPYTVTLEDGAVARSYAGVGEEKLNLAVWADGEYTYAVVAADGLANADMQALAESV